MSGSEKGPVDLFLEDVAKYLEEARVGKDTGKLWHAVLYLLRAVNELADRSGGERVSETLEDVRKRIAIAVGFLEDVSEEEVSRGVRRLVSAALTALKWGNS